MIHVVARIKAKQRCGPQLVDAFKELLPQVHAETGCVAYEATIDARTDIDRQEPVDADAVTMVERWESLEHLKAHLVAPHMLEFRTKTKDLIEGAELRILEQT